MSKTKIERNKEIIRLFRSGGWGYKKLSKRFKVSYKTISLMITRYISSDERKEILKENYFVKGIKQRQ